MCKRENANVISARNGKEVNAIRREPIQLGAHSNGNKFITVAVKNGQLRSGTIVKDFAQVCPIVVTLNEKHREPAATNYGSFLPQSGKGGDYEQALHMMMRSKVERHRGAE